MGFTTRCFIRKQLKKRILSRLTELISVIYARYIHGIFIITQAEEEVFGSSTDFKSNCSLEFICETESQKKLLFSDVLVHRCARSFTGKVCVKEIYLGFCLNAAIECPEKGRHCIISSFAKEHLPTSLQGSPLTFNFKKSASP